ncbi:hypothetical protein MQX03_16560 [Chryseobacterium aahli]|uniref:hypothetical protein n=1 Tax=Chryseobacterium aahli TaxID=1278643 RepID=UPI001F6060FD|nr:hypothetical protein [Chryseobacterium aahli]MCI3938813.1 hypothetical protein [Chryseobacterium aahli]
MKKNRSSISTHVRPNGTTWKLGFFFSFLLILTSNSAFAHSETHASELVVDSSTVSGDQTPETIIYITEGTTVYGIDNLSQTPIQSSSSNGKDSKKHEKKKLKVFAQKKKEIHTASKPSKPEIKTLASRHPSSDSFEVSKFSKSVGTISANTPLKSALHNTVIDIKTASISFFNNSLYSYTLPFTKDITDRYSFARPPPAV